MPPNKALELTARRAIHSAGSAIRRALRFRGMLGRYLEDLHRHEDALPHVGACFRLNPKSELDSIRLLTLAMEIEDRFEICLDEEDEESILTVADLVGVVRRKLAA